MKYIKLNQGVYAETLPNINTVWDDNNYCTPEALIGDGKAEQFGVAEMVDTPQPTYDSITQTIEESTPILIEGVWTQRWTVTSLPIEQAELNLLNAKNQVWERIKQERDRRKFAGVKVGADWLHCDTDSRGQWERMVNRVNAQELADSTGYTIGGQPVPWKTMTGSFVVLTAGKIRAVVDAVELQEAMIFGRAEMHRVAMEASSTPETYDFSSGWPASIEDAP